FKPKFNPDDESPTSYDRAWNYSDIMSGGTSAQKVTKKRWHKTKKHHKIRAFIDFYKRRLYMKKLLVGLTALAAVGVGSTTFADNPPPAPASVILAADTNAQGQNSSESNQNTQNQNNASAQSSADQPSTSDDTSSGDSDTND